MVRPSVGAVVLSLLCGVSRGDVPDGGVAPIQRPLQKLPYTPGLDVAAMDRSVDPCVDFYAYACNGWRKSNPTPADQSHWGVYSKLADENRQLLWGLLEEAAQKPDAKRTPEERLTGDYFAACMNEAAVEAAGAKPLAPWLAAIDALANKKALAALVGKLHDAGADQGHLFGFGSMQSFDDSEQMVAGLAAGGLGLPDRDYYLKTDDRSKQVREKYQAHVQRLLELSGLTAAQATAGAKAVLRLETALAKASLTRVERREPKNLWHPTTKAALQKLAPSFAWADYFSATQAPAFEWLDVTQPAYFKELDRQLAKEDLATWKVYLRWHLFHQHSPLLSARFRDETFAFFGAYLTGAKEQPPRWKRCVGRIDSDLGEALGKLFVERVFPAQVRTDTEEVVRQVQVVMRRRLEQLDWMGPATRATALAKLTSMRNKIGYPMRWRDYSGLVVARDDDPGNAERAARFEQRRTLAKVGKPVDRDEWQMSAPSVNAYYEPSMNDMNFPAGVLLPPLWDPKMDLAPGYGNTGSTVGHELVHGFDDEGRKFDPQGNLKDWWTAEDAKKFDERAQCIADQYAQYTVVDDIKINSKLTLGEDIADLGGTVLAYQAWKNATAGQKLAPRDGLSPEQRFFVGLAQWACANPRPEMLRLMAATNPHSPEVWRINGVVANMPEFAAAFACKKGAPMVREKPCRIW